MVRLSSTVGCLLLAWIDISSAGRKSPRPGASLNLPRALTNASNGRVSLDIKTKTGTKNATAPYLYGWMFEDINHSGDGGLYGELLTNRAFDGSDVGWGAIPNVPGSSIVYQENTCVPFGESGQENIEASTASI